jgi:hypothetical protein
MDTRGGTYFIFNNTINATGGSYDTFLDLRNYRSDSAYSSSWGPCDGTNSIDQNTPGQQGWVCQDQVGRAGGQTAFGTLEAAHPGYSWTNMWKGSRDTGTSNIGICGYQNCTRANAYHILNNREFYNEAVSFDGTTGVGTGLLSARPSTCTPLVAYWATDTNVLYQCTSTNTWTTYYTPYTYPHPLQGGTLPPSPCDVNGDGTINVADVQLEVNMALGINPCTNASGTCTVVSVQRVVNAALGGQCVNP